MPESHPITNREADALTHALASLTTRIDRLTETIDDTYVRKDLYEARHTVIQDRLSGLENWRDWVFKTVLGLVIVAVVTTAFILTQGGV